MLVASGKADTALTLCRGIASRAPQACWVHRRSGYLLAAAEQYEEGVIAFQTALKTDVQDASAWEGLASCYQSLGRFTAALKAYTRALELQPARAYARIQSGNIHMALGSFAEGIAQFEAAMEIAPNHPAAQLGAAESLAVAAGVHARQGALGTAADELAKAAGCVLCCVAKHGTLQAAWKLLGDVLVLHHAITPSTQHPTIPSGAGSSSGAAGAQRKGREMDAELGAWRRRMEAMRQARRAYAKALHLNPVQSGAWQDAAFAYYHEGQLLRAHPAVASDGSTDASLGSLTAAAERAARAGLRMEPASADLWAALGTLAAEPAAREYTLSRALQLDPKCVSAWVALARLYAEHGAAGPAASALQHARSHEPAVPAIWEAMADVAALSSTGTSEQADFQEHAYGLGAGPTGLLGFSELAMHVGRALEGPVYVAAKKVAHMQPLNPTAHNVLGLASEARGDFTAAAAAYRLALQLLPGIRDPNASVLQPSTIPSTSISLHTAVQLNLARVLMRAGSVQEAAQRYEELEVSAVLYDHPPAWLACAAAKRATGDLSGAEMAVQSAVNPDTPAKLLAAAVCATMQLQCEAGRPAAALAHLQQQLPVLRAANLLLADMEELWVTAAAGAAVVPDVLLLRQALDAARTWAVEVDNDSAAFLARLHGVEAAGSLVAEQTGHAVAHYSKAVHLCPDDASLRVAMAAALLMRPAAPGAEASASAEAALQLLESPLVASAVAPGKELPRVAPAGKALPEAALEASTAALLGAKRLAPEQLSRHMSAAVRSVHESPANPRRWYRAALVAKKAAAMGDGSRSSSERAWRWCRAAEAVVGRAAVAAF